MGKLAELVQEAARKVSGMPNLAEVLGTSRDVPHRWVKDSEYWDTKMRMCWVRGLAGILGHTPGGLVNEVEGVRWSASDLDCVLCKLPEEDRRAVAISLLQKLAVDADPLLSTTLNAAAQALIIHASPKGLKDFLQWYCQNQQMPYSARSIPVLFADVLENSAAQAHQQLQEVVLGMRDSVDQELLYFIHESLKKKLPWLTLHQLEEINSNRWYKTDFS